MRKTKKGFRKRMNGRPAQNTQDQETRAAEECWGDINQALQEHSFLISSRVYIDGNGAVKSTPILVRPRQ